MRRISSAEGRLSSDDVEAAVGVVGLTPAVDEEASSMPPADLTSSLLSGEVLLLLTVVEQTDADREEAVEGGDPSLVKDAED